MNKFLFHTDLKYRISRHITFFVIIVLVFTLVLFSRNPEDRFFNLLWLTFINALIFLGYGYLTIFILIPYFLPSRKYFLLGASFLSLGIFLSVLKLSISDFIFYSSISPEFSASNGMLNIRFILINTKDMSFIVALFVIARFTKDWLIAENQHKLLQKTYEELNLTMLQSQFEPHFLFNTLNNLYALSLNNQDKTLDVIRKFKHVLSYTIIDSQKSKVPVQEELEMIDNFIAIEQIRYGARLRVKTSITGDCNGWLIAPFLLFTLVENCFKHGSSTDAGKPWIRISFSCDRGRINFETRNSMPKKFPQAVFPEEHGLDRLKERLRLIYPKNHSFTVEDGDQEFTARLELDLNGEK
ncbi:MAG: histidine kinase [Prolixibacteraceae bacterium]